jgi:hypothetical protein
MTKYFKDNTNAKEYADRPIAIATSEDDVEEIICTSCRVINYQTRGDDYEHSCKHCGYILDVRREVEAADIIESESMDDNPQPLVSYGEDPNELYFKGKRPEYKGGFSELQGRGIHITAYTES